MDLESVQQALQDIRKVKGSQLFHDVHVHPFEVMYEPRSYHAVPAAMGLYSAGTLPYTAPRLSDLSLDEPAVTSERPTDGKLLSMASLFNARKAYSHTGPLVIGDLMELAVVDRALLLPVLKKNDPGDAQSQDLAVMFGNDKRFRFGYCLPSMVPDEQAVMAVGQAVGRFGVQVLKIHPSISGIDLGKTEGLRRIELLLEASRLHRLKVIIHGGLSPECPDRQAATFGKVENLRRIDWSLTPETVIIAHGGCFGYTTAEAKTSVIPELLKLLERFANLAIDTSALKIEVLCCLLEQIDFSRLYFGSDALYEREWGAMVTLWNALRKSVKDCEAALSQIAGSNPGRFLAS